MLFWKKVHILFGQYKERQITMKLLSLFNNKGGVGKTTLAFHLSSALAELNKKVLMLDLDPQCNLTIFGMDEEKLHSIWEIEDSFIDVRGFDETKKKMTEEEFQQINSTPRTIHYLLKPTEEGTGEVSVLSPPVKIRPNLDLIPGRLTLHMYENKVAERWSGAYQGDPLSIRTITKIRTIAHDYTKAHHYDYVIVDTSPSLGALNKVIISTVDGFLIPCLPDMFSMYGIRNIGNSLTQWKKELDTIYKLISDEKRKHFPDKFVQFLGYTIYNARKYKDASPWDLAQAHYNYAKQIPATIEQYIKPEVRENLSGEMIKTPIGHTKVMHSHSTLPGMAQKYKTPIWDIPNISNLEKDDISTIRGNRAKYEATKDAYISFAHDLIKRLATLD